MPSHSLRPGAVTRTTPAVGAQRLVRHGREGVGAGRPPGEGELLSAAALEVVDAQRVRALGEFDGAVLGFGAVQPVVVDHHLVVDQQP